MIFIWVARGLYPIREQGRKDACFEGRDGQDGRRSGHGSVLVGDHALKFVMFDEGRTLTTETPFYGNAQKEDDICKPQVYTADFSSRHTAGGCIGFADGHTSWFKYTYVCANAGAKAADPGAPDIQWPYDGHVVP
jgi:hypothetical protein